jgi:hypothetical protein
MMHLDFWTWPLPVVNVGPNILLLLRAKLTCSGVGNDTTQERCLSFSVRWFLWVRCVQSVHGRTPNIPLHGIQKAPGRHCVQAARGGTTTSVTTACARAVREYIRHAGSRLG